MKKSEYLLYAETPAKYFTDAYPVGNGKLGGMVYGGFDEFKIGLNHDELWAMGETYTLEDYDPQAFKRAQGIALNGDYVAAERALESGLMKGDSAAYLPFGDMIFKMPKGEISNYTRTLNLKTAVSSVSYLLDGKRVDIDTIASFKDGVIAVKFGFETPLNFTFKFNAVIDESVNYSENGVIVRGRCYATTENHTFRNSFPKDRINAPTVAFSGAFKAVCNGEQKAYLNRIEFINATEAVVYFAAATSYKNGKAFVVKNYEQAAVKAVEKAAAKGYAEVLKAHLKDYKKLFDGAAEISLGHNPPKTLITEKRLENYRNGEKDFDLITLAFNYGKYLLIAGSRKGSRALNLQGIWNPFVNAPWSSEYTTNINLEMNYWPALPLGLKETLGPLEEEIGLIYKNGKLAAKHIFNSDGVCAAHNSDIFGYAYFVAGMAQYSFFPFSIHWLSRELYEKYLYTGDINYLKKLYPLFVELVKFINDTLIFDGKYYIFAPATSAENAFYTVDGKRVSVSLGTEFFAAIIRDTAHNFIEMSEVLGETSGEEYKKIKGMYDKLLPTLITPDGRIAEWYFGDGKNSPEEDDPHHRHVSNLFAMFPTGEITYNDKEYAEAVKKSLDTRGDASTGWSITWKMNLRARLHDGEGLNRLFKLYFNKVDSTDSTEVTLKGGVYANLFCAHPPFQIDGNFGVTRAITEMLVQEVGGELSLLPALIPDVYDGKVKRIRLKNNKKIDFDIVNGKAENVKIY